MAELFDFGLGSNFGFGDFSTDLSGSLGEFYDPGLLGPIDPGPLLPDLAFQDFSQFQFPESGFDFGLGGGADLSIPDFNLGGGGADLSIPDTQLRLGGVTGDLFFNSETQQIEDAQGRPVDLGGGGGALALQRAGERDLSPFLGPGTPEFRTPISPADAALARRGGFGPQPGGGGGGILGGAGAFLGSDLGRILAAGGIGALGLGAARLAAGGVPRLNLPAFTPAPATLAGQEAVMDAFRRGVGPQLTDLLQLAVAGQRGIGEQVAGRVARETAAERFASPYEELIRAQALGIIPGTLAPDLYDPIQEGLRAELTNVLGSAGGGISPATLRRQQQEEEQARARLTQQLGRDYELTTPGIQTLQELARRHNEERFTERQATIARLSPLEESRLRGLRGERSQGLAQAGQFSRFGLAGVPENLTALARLAPASSLLGGDPDEARRINQQLSAQQALTGFGADVESRRSLAQGIAGITGTVAGGVLDRPSRYEDLLAGVLANQYGAGAYA